MGLERDLHDRSGSKCELCSATQDLTIYEVPPQRNGGLEEIVHCCGICSGQIEDPDTMVEDHWRCLNDSMWSQHAAVQVVSWRMLTRLRGLGWPQDLLDMLYLEEEVLEWAKATGEGAEEDRLVHRDSNGAILQTGDNVVLIKDLPVKGSSMVAKRGTAVRKISLDHENAEYVEGKVDGQQIVILTKYVKKM
ncbi:MAG: PhnA domain-containing protein [Sediminicola sp.]